MKIELLLKKELLKLLSDKNRKRREEVELKAPKIKFFIQIGWKIGAAFPVSESEACLMLKLEWILWQIWNGNLLRCQATKKLSGNETSVVVVVVVLIEKTLCDVFAFKSCFWVKILGDKAFQEKNLANILFNFFALALICWTWTLTRLHAYGSTSYG